MENYHLKNFGLVLENKISKKDLFIHKNKLSFKKLKTDYTIIDGQNINYILPGGIDVHTHISLDLGKDRTSSDNYFTCGRAALNGGITTLFDFAHHENKKDTLLTAYNRRLKMSKDCAANIFFHAGIINTETDISKEIYEIAKQGVFTFKLYLNSPTVTDLFLYKCFKAIKSVGGIALIHCEPGDMVEYLKQKFYNENKRSVFMHPKSRPDYFEEFAIRKCIDIAKFFDTNIYIVHLTTQKGLDLIKQEQKNLSFLECEVAPHHLLLTENIYSKDNGYYYTCCPPLRKKKDNENLWNGLKKNIIKNIATDHCPFTVEQKEKFSDSFTNYVFGLPGVETSYNIMLSEGKKRGFSLNQIVKLCSTNPAKLFRLFPDRGVIREGSIADIVIYNPEHKWKINHKKLLMNCDFNQFNGLNINGKIEKTFINGKLFEK
jgi:dihydropyrimidinase